MTLFRVSTLIIGVSLLVSGFFWSSNMAKEVTKWPDNYSEVYYLNHTENNRFNFVDSWTGNVISNSKIEIKSTDVSKISSRLERNFIVESLSGETLFNLNQNFLIDKYTRHNYPGGTDVQGLAFIDFPPNVQKIDYVWWPATFGSPFNMKFIDEGNVKGVHVYHFQSQNITLDDTSGYSFLPLVPENYKVLSNATIDAYVEPITGILINYFDKGISYYSDSKITRIWDISQWSDKYSGDMINRTVEIAKKRMNAYLLHKNIIPTAFYICGMILILYSLLLRKKK